MFPQHVFCQETYVWETGIFNPVIRKSHARSESYNIYVKRNGTKNFAYLYHRLIHNADSRGFRPSDVIINKAALIEGSVLTFLKGYQTIEQLSNMSNDQLDSLRSNEYLVYNCGTYYHVFQDNYKKDHCREMTFTHDKNIYSCGLASFVNNNGKIGFKNANNVTVIPPIYDEVYAFSDGYASVKKGTKWGLIDTKGKTIIPFVYSWIGIYKFGYVPVSETADWLESYFVDKTGKRVFDNRYYAVGPFCDQGIANVRIKQLISNDFVDYRNTFIDTKGLDILGNKYDGCDPNLQNGMIVVHKNNKYGCVDTNGKEIISPIYDYVYPGTKGIIVKKNDKCGYLDYNSKYILPLEYDDLEISNEKIKFKKNGYYGFMDLNGDIKLNAEYKKLFLSKNYVAIEKHYGNFFGDQTKYEKWWIVDNNGKRTIDTDYGSLHIIGEYALVKKDGSQYYIKCLDGTYYSDLDGFYEVPSYIKLILNKTTH